MEDFYSHLYKFLIAFVLLCVLPIWFLNFTGGVGFFKKVLITIIMGAITWFVVGYGGTRRGIFTR